MKTNKERLAIMETEVTQIKKDVEGIHVNIKEIFTKLDTLSKDIQSNKWKIGAVVGIMSFVGALVATRLVDMFV